MSFSWSTTGPLSFEFVPQTHSGGAEASDSSDDVWCEKHGNPCPVGPRLWSQAPPRRRPPQIMIAGRSDVWGAPSLRLDDVSGLGRPTRCRFETLVPIRPFGTLRQRSARIWARAPAQREPVQRGVTWGYEARPSGADCELPSPWGASWRCPFFWNSTPVTPATSTAVNTTWAKAMICSGTCPKAKSFGPFPVAMRASTGAPSTVVSGLMAVRRKVTCSAVVGPAKSFWRTFSTVTGGGDLPLTRERQALRVKY